MVDKVEKTEVVEVPPVIMPDPQPAFHALDKYRSVIGGHGPRSDEEVVLCDEAHDALDEYFALKDAVGAPEPPAREAAAKKGKKDAKNDYPGT